MKRIYSLVFFATVAALVGSFTFGFLTFKDGLPNKIGGFSSLNWQIQAKIVILLGWTVVPPLLLWAEYFGVYRRNVNTGRPKPDDFDEFKHGQDLSSKLWLAVSTALLILYFGKDLRH